MSRALAEDGSQSDAARPRSRARRAVAWLLLLALLALIVRLAPVLVSDRMFQGDDFIEYWSATRLALNGQNPYDATAMTRFQAALGRDAPVLMWNPPHALALSLPVSLLPYDVGRVLWFFAGIAVIFLAVIWLWEIYRGSPRTLWVALLVAFCFFPTLDALRKGQISPLILLGLVGFLRYQVAGKPIPAGLFAALISVKPHWMALFWIALLLWTAREKRWRTLGAAAVAILCASLVALAFHPAVFGQYLDAATRRSPIYWVTPTLGGALRSSLGAELIRLQFLPALFGLAWLAVVWRRRGATWDWREQLPGVVVVSALTAVYGWTFDQVALLAALLPAVALLLDLRPRRVAVGLGLLAVAINAAALLHRPVTYGWYWWHAPAWAAWCWLVWRAARRRPPDRDDTAPAPAEAA